jgi:hypothetical protein
MKFAPFRHGFKSNTGHGLIAIQQNVYYLACTVDNHGMDSNRQLNDLTIYEAVRSFDSSPSQTEIKCPG